MRVRATNPHPNPLPPAGAGAHVGTGIPARVATNLAGTAQGHVLTAATMDAHNTFAQPQALVPARYAAQPGAAGLTLELPPKSIVVVAVSTTH